MFETCQRTQNPKDLDVQYKFIFGHYDVVHEKFYCSVGSFHDVDLKTDEL